MLIKRNPYTQSLIAFFSGCSVTLTAAGLDGQLDLMLPVWCSVITSIVLIIATIDITISTVRKLKNKPPSETEK